MRKLTYEDTIHASYLGYITQAIVNNYVPLLFLRFVSEFSLNLEQIALVTSLNFAIQLLVDLICARVIDRVGYRKAIVFAHACAVLGLVGLAIFPAMMNAFAGIICAVVLYAIGGGIIEVLISPIVEACPTEKKEAAMSLLHSFYCWGHVGVVVLSTVFFLIAGIQHWRILACLWALVPLCNLLFFCFVPIYPIVSEQEKISFRSLCSMRVFWVFMVLMICAGASEQAMSQWTSAFAEATLHITKTVGDLVGPCLFALCMGTSRALYGKYSEQLPLKKMMIYSAILCVISYAMTVFFRMPVFALAGCALCGFSVGIFWPGTFSMVAINLRQAGTAMYALMALAGDIGCSIGPGIVGMTAGLNHGNIRMGFLAAMGFPLLLCGLLWTLKDKKS